MLERGYRHFVVLLDSDESCGNDVEDELALERCDNPGTAGTIFFHFALGYFPLLGQMWLLPTGPLAGVTVFFAELA